MLSVKKVLSKLLNAHKDAYITRTYSLGGVNSYYANNDINIGVAGYTPISVSFFCNQATTHFYRLAWTNTVLSVGRAQWNTTMNLASNSVEFVVRYLKNELVGGVVNLLNTLQSLTSGRRWSTC